MSLLALYEFGTIFALVNHALTVPRVPDSRQTRAELVVSDFVNRISNRNIIAEIIHSCRRPLPHLQNFITSFIKTTLPGE